MSKLNQNGSLVAPLAITIVLLVSSLGFAGWAFLGRQDYKNNVDEKIAAAVKVAKAEESLKKDAEFNEASKSPFKTFNSGSETIGNLSFQYPKSWSAYASSSEDGNSIFSAYFYPDVIPDLTNTNFPLRIEVVNESYNEILEQLSSSGVSQGELTSAGFRAAKVPSVLGSILTGKLEEKKSGTLVILPLRDKTIKIWTENNSFISDFNNTILPSLTFAP